MLQTMCGCGIYCGDNRTTRRSFLSGSIAIAAMAPACLGVAQEKWSSPLKETCSFYPDDVIGKDIYTFSNLSEATDAVQGIVRVSGLSMNFQILQANVPNAAAVIRNNQRFILYSQVFIDQVNSATRNSWAAKTILAHEVGHHLNGHTLTGTGSQPPIELEADKYAGFTIAALGGSLDDALSPYRTMSESGSMTHPPRSARLEAVSNGWHERMRIDSKPVPDNGKQPASLIDRLVPILKSIQAGQMPRENIEPKLAALIQQQMQQVSMGMKAAGDIQSATVTSEKSSPAGGTELVATVKHANATVNWVMITDATGLIVGLYFRP